MKQVAPSETVGFTLGTSDFTFGTVESFSGREVGEVDDVLDCVEVIIGNVGILSAVLKIVANCKSAL